MADLIASKVSLALILRLLPGGRGVVVARPFRDDECPRINSPPLLFTLTSPFTNILSLTDHLFTSRPYHSPGLLLTRHVSLPSRYLFSLQLFFSSPNASSSQHWPPASLPTQAYFPYPSRYPLTHSPRPTGPSLTFDAPPGGSC
ncbi:hypothetical protein E2C01_053292 [Portunus trituberculatus]|uniref:Uncharacterized protein n=1 Tax=Portunus trituberculatus TaxID=210409 RepID=A0A5B7GP33_PORTR|nr:hypothetical protein [Portunus trituberculatus]